MTKKSTFYDRLLHKAKDNRLVASVLLIALILSGVFSFIGSMEKLAWLWPRQKQPNVEIAQFTLNSNASPYFSRHELKGKIELYEIGNIGGRGYQRPTGKFLDLEGVQEWQLIDVGSELLTMLLSGPSDKEIDHKAFSRLPGPIREKLQSGTERERAEVFSGIDPIFDVTFINKGEEATILSGIDADIECVSSGGDVGEPIAIPPLGVSHRYQVDIGSEGETPLLPPIRIPPGEAVRIQVQLTSHKSHYGWWNTDYLLRFKFNFGSDSPVYTERFGINHGGGLGTECGGLWAGGL